MLVSCLPISSQWDPTKSSSCIDQIALFTAALSTDVITDGNSFTCRPGVGKVQSNDIIVRSHSSTSYIPGVQITNATSTEACRHWDFWAWCISHNHRDRPSTFLRFSRCSIWPLPWSYPYVCPEELWVSSTSTKLVGRQFLRSRRLGDYRDQRWHPECMSTDAAPIVRGLPNQLACV